MESIFLEEDKRAEIRRNLINNATAFLNERCWYNSQEEEAVRDLLKTIEPVNKDGEIFNEKHAVERQEQSLPANVKNQKP